MTPARIQILRQVLELEPSERAGFIERACTGQPDLREELQRLLALDAAENALLDGDACHIAASLIATTPGTGDEDGLIDTLHAGALVGAWRIQRQLGSGGMGSVWLAERADGGFQQQVALKMIRPGMDSAAVLAAFRRERELLAHLKHPGIAHLVDGGVDASGRPWYAMRHVEGSTLDQWLEQNPPLTERLKLFVMLCRTVANAHRQLVVHRDLKPGNVIVQPDGTPCLLDFGIAKILQHEPFDATATIERFASPGYAAPEQVNGGQITTATDVYGLGAILFELLTGIRYNSVHRGGDVPTRASQAIRDTSLQLVLAIAATRLLGDLDAIAMRALVPDPARRYTSADALADDMQRHLDGLPVQARPDGWGYRMSSWIRRNRLAAAGLSLALLALLAGTGISLWQAQRATTQAQRATAVKDYVISLFDAGRTNSAGTAMLERPVIDMLDASATRLKDDLHDQPDLRDELYTTLVEIYDANNHGERSMALARERIAMAEAAFGNTNERVAPALLLLVGVLLNHEQFDEVPALLARAEALLDAAGDQRSMARAQWLQYSGKFTFEQAISADMPPLHAIDFFKRASALMRSRFPDSDELLVTLFSLAQTATWGHQSVTAQAALDELRERTRQHHGNAHFYLTQANLIQATLWIDEGRAEEALALVRQGHHDVVHFVGEHHNDVLAARFYELRALLALGRIDEADTLWQEIDAWRRRYHPGVAHMEAATQAMRARIDQAQIESAAH